MALVGKIALVVTIATSIGVASASCSSQRHSPLCSARADCPIKPGYTRFCAYLDDVRIWSCVYFYDPSGQHDCLTSAECPPRFPTCANEQRCVAACLADTDCRTTPWLWCRGSDGDAGLGHCAECRIDQNCAADEHCEAGSCRSD
jgi:hypothetical protein